MQVQRAVDAVAAHAHTPESDCLLAFVTFNSTVAVARALADYGPSSESWWKYRLQVPASAR